MREELELEESNEISLGEIFGVIKKRFWFLVVITIIGGIMLGIYAFGIAKPKYKTTGSLMVQVKTTVSSGDEIFNSLESQRLLETVVQILNMDVIHQQVHESLKPTYNISAGAIKGNMSVANKNNGLIISVGYTSESKVEAREVTNAIINTLVDFLNDPTSDIAVTFKGNIVKLDVPEAKYVSPNKPLLVLVGMVLGGTVGLIMVFSYEMINAGYKTKEELEAATKVQVLGVIPQFQIVRGDSKW